MATYRILSLDGGGVRGAFAARLLERLEAAHPGFIARADLIAGTSAGGLLALGLAKGLPPARCRALIEDNAPNIFPRDFPYSLGLFRTIKRFFAALYGNDDLRDALYNEFGDLKLKDLRPRVLITTFDLDGDLPDRPRTWKPKFFHNFEETPRGGPPDREQTLLDVALRTTAAPTFFPIYQGFVDGGVVANNPSMCALAQALHAPTGGQRLDDVVLLSLGTGVDPTRLEAQDKSWGIAQWFLRKVKLTDALVGGVEDVAEFQCRQVMQTRFHRLNPVLCQPGRPELCDIGLDVVKAIPALVRFADSAPLTDARAQVETVKWLRDFWMRD